MSNWEKVILKELFDLSIPGEWGNAPDGVNDTLVLRAADFTKDCKLKSKIGSARVIPGIKLLTRSLVSGDILLEKSGGSPDQPVGRVVYFDRESNKYSLSNFLQLLRVNKNYDSLWVYYLLIYLYNSNVVLKYQQQTTGIINFKLEEYLSEEISIPMDTGVQKKISKILTTIDQLIDKTQAIIDKHAAIKQGMMLDIFTRGIDLTTGQLRPPVEQAPHLYEETELGWIPKEWELPTLEDITSQIIDGTHHTPTYTESGVPFLRVTDVQTDVINKEKIKYISEIEHAVLIKRCKPQKGDILYSKNGTIGIPKLIDWDWEFSVFVSLSLIKPNTNIISGKYLTSLLNSDSIWQQIRKRAKQGTVTNLHLEEIREFLIPLPNKNEQDEIIKRLFSQENNIRNEGSRLKKLKNTKKGLMHDLLTGKVAVN